MNSLEIWKLLREYIDKNTTLYLKEKTHIETVEGQPLDKIEKDLKDYEWLKSIIPFDARFMWNLSSDDKIRLLKIMGVEL